MTILAGPYSKIFLRLIASAGVIAIGSGVPAAQADPTVLPSGGIVTAGSASIVATDPASTLIVQRGRNAVINWQNFSIGAGASVTFQQPDSASIALNRVTGQGASIINGNLLANGQIWLVNGNGILFGQGSRIDVGGLIATTSDIKDADFLSGRYAFSNASGNPDAAVINRGSIKAATGGSTVLSGARVVNEGLIQAKLGHVVLGGANAFSVDFDGDKLIQYQVAAPVSATPKGADGKPVAALVSNSGTIVAQGGTVLMTARAARNIVDNVINSTGIIQARSASIRNGEVILDAGEGAASVGGTIDVTGPGAGESGGTIAVLGEQVAIADTANLNASGDAGGGTIMVGRNPHSTDPAPNAQTVNVGKSIISADATGSGKGGTVTVFSAGKTSVAASLSAKGVASGGMVETSGHDLDIAADTRVDTSASAGDTGLWLLDPVFADAANITNSLGSTNVTVTASDDIIVNAPIVYNSPNTLAFLAGGNLRINANVQNGEGGAILAVAGWDGVTGPSNILAAPGAYGNGGGSVFIGGAGPASGGVAFGSRNGLTTVASADLYIIDVKGYAQLGYHSNALNTANTSGNISVVLTGDLVIANNGSDGFAQIGHGGPGVAGSQAGNIDVVAQGNLLLTGNSASNSYALIGHGDRSGGGNHGGKVFLEAGKSILLSAEAFVSGGGVGDTLVLAAADHFFNFSGSAALKVSGGGRWLVFSNAPANNEPGGLSASPFYNRPFDFSANSYAPVTGVGNRFVYALAPMVTVTVADQTKTYGSANALFSATVTGGLAGDAPAGVFAGTPSIGTVATARSDVGDYAITGGLGTLSSDFNYGFQFVDGTLHINPATVAASLTGTVQKGYDGTTAAALSATNYQLTGVLSGDSVTLTGPANGVYDSKDVGTFKTVSATGLTLLGPDAGNYVLTAPALSGAVGVINPATVAASLTGTVQKGYDGTTAAALSAANYQLTGVLSGDSVTLIGPAKGVYDSKGVGTSKSVSVTGLTLQGPDKGNYALAAPVLSGAVGVINPATLAASLTGTVQKVYDGTTAAALSATNYQLTGVLSGDSVTLTGANGLYDSKDVGTSKTVSATGLTLQGPDKGNYALAAPVLSGAVGVINPATLAASLTGTVQKVYDGTTAAALSATNYQLTGVLSGDSVTLTGANGLYDSKDVGTSKTVSATGLTLLGSDRANYVLAAPTLSGAVGVINPVTVAASLTGTVQKVYDGTAAAALSATNYQLTGVLSGDSVTLTGANGLYDSKDVGTSKTVSATGLTLLGSDRANYVLAAPALSGAVGVINPATAAASLTGTVQKGYDGTTAAALSATNYQLTGVLSGDSVTLTGPANGVYDSKDVGTFKTVSATGLTLLGPDAGNYALASPGVSGAVGTITIDRVGDLLGNSYTSNAVLNVSLVSQGFARPTGSANAVASPSDATSDTAASDDASAQSDASASQVGKSLSGMPGSARSSTSVVIDGLLRQFFPPPGAALPHGVPPYGQVYSSWGNEAFWQ